MKDSSKLQKIIFGFVFASMVISVVIIAFLISKAPEVATETGQMVKGDYSLMFAQSILGIFAMMLPSFVSKRLQIIIPSNMLILYVVFLYCAIFLGEVRSYYYDVEHWDTMLHGFSGGMIGIIGYSFVNLLNKSDNIDMKLSPLFVSVFAFCFAITLGVVWEVYEYTFDGILGLNMQKFMLEDKTPLVGRAALNDTMKDLIVDAAGAFVACLLGYISLKNKAGFIKKLEIRRKTKKGK